MAATAEVASPPPPQLSGEETGGGGGICCSALTGMTEPSNGYHTHTDTHKQTDKAHRKPQRHYHAGKELEEDGALQQLNSSSSQDFHHTSLVLSLCRAVEFAPPPPPHPTPQPFSAFCTHTANLEPPLVSLLVFFLSFTRTLLGRQNTPAPSPMLSAGAHFSPNTLSESSVWVCVRL